MEKWLDMLVEELTARVIKKMAEDSERMQEFTKVNRVVQAADVDGLSEFVNDRINDALDNLEVNIDASASLSR